MRILKKKHIPKNKAQLELDFDIPKEKDRNFHLGGKSFYFFDFDDNVAFLSTPIVIFHKKTGEERLLSSGTFARVGKDIGIEGHYKDYYCIYGDDVNGSFRYCRDQSFNLIDRIKGKKQSFLNDIQDALNNADYNWKAPAWNSFYHAAYNQRPMSIITARGHFKQTIVDGIDLMVKDGHLPLKPNYLTVYPVSNTEVRKELGDEALTASVPELKRRAIRESVNMAIKKYGENPFHRFGMSDDDPKNVELITEEMKVLKRDYPEMSFYVIQTFKDSFTKFEVLSRSTRNIISKSESIQNQLSLF